MEDLSFCLPHSPRRRKKIDAAFLVFKSGRVFGKVRIKKIARGKGEKQRKNGKNRVFDVFLPFFWWEEVDSNYRSRRRQIYSLIHLATLESSRI